MFSTKTTPILAVCLVTIANAVAFQTKVQTLSINSPKSGAHLNPVGALINTKINSHLFSPFGAGYGSPYGFINPHVGFSQIGYGGGFAGGYGGGLIHGYPKAIGGYPSKLGGHAAQYGIGYPGIPGSYTVQTGFPVFGHAKAGAYPVAQGFGGYPALGVKGYPYGGQIGYPYGGAINKLGGYGK